jgi:hypothetical protein
MMAAITAAVRATSALRLVSEGAGLSGWLGFTADELPGLITGAEAGATDGVEEGSSTAAVANATGLEKLDAADGADE